MTVCEPLAAEATTGIAAALRAVDCLANETAATAFSRLFGSNGAMVPALTGLLTLYIAFFAISLLTGRSRIGISALTPRMMTLGLVLTFATSWVAYQNVVWTLATAAPDEIAGVLTGANGSATRIFADRMDIILGAVSEAAGGGAVATEDGAAAGGAANAGASGAQGSFSPGNLTWLSALLLLLGTVGILVTARIALAVLLAVGPVFVVLALFPGTRGLTAGWLRGVVMMAVIPLFVVLSGGLILELLVPVVRLLASPEGISGRAAMALFTIASVHLALMVMVMKITGSLVAGWQVFGLAPSKSRDGAAPAGNVTVHGAAGREGGYVQPDAASLSRKGTAILPVTALAAPDSGGSGASAAAPVRTGQVMAHPVAANAAAATVPGHRRNQGIGSHYRRPQTNAPLHPLQGKIR